jgi:hypothetical protein
LEPNDAAEILLVARWFELRPKELKRTATPEKWLAEGGIRPVRQRVRAARRTRDASAKATHVSAQPNHVSTRTAGSE